MILRYFGVTEEKASQIASLSYAVRFRVLVGYLGKFCLVLAGLAVVPAIVSLGVYEYYITARYLLVIGALVITGGLMTWTGEAAQLQFNESMVLSALMFLVAPLVMTYPMAAAGMPFLDTVFEAVSAATTTGLSTTATLADKPRTFLFSRAWMQWYGGLGIVFVSLALVVSPGLSAKRLSGGDEERRDLIGSSRAHARWVLLIYVLLTVAGITSVWIVSSQGLFNSVLYTFSAVSTGGFSPHDASLGALSGVGPVFVVTLLSVAGAISMVTYRRLYREGVSTLVEDRQWQILLFLGVGVSVLLFFGYEVKSISWTGNNLWHAFVTGFSAQSSTGFSTVAMDQFSPAGKLVIILSMLVGGCIGSTAGGFKIFRLMIVMRLILFLVVRSAMPRDAVVNPRFGDDILTDTEIKNALTIILLFFGTILVSWFPFLIYGHDPLNSLFEVVSATGTVGLSSGITGPDLAPFLKSVLCVDMLMGRLEMLAWIVLFYPRTWFGNRRAVKAVSS